MALPVLWALARERLDPEASGTHLKTLGEETCSVPLPALGHKTRQVLFQLLEGDAKPIPNQELSADPTVGTMAFCLRGPLELPALVPPGLGRDSAAALASYEPQPSTRSQSQQNSVLI